MIQENYPAIAKLMTEKAKLLRDISDLNACEVRVVPQNTMSPNYLLNERTLKIVRALLKAQYELRINQIDKELELL